jgi:hypothetical protein
VESGKDTNDAVGWGFRISCALTPVFAAQKMDVINTIDANLVIQAGFVAKR